MLAIVFYPSKLYTAYAVRASMSLRSGLLLYEIHELEPQESSTDCQSPIGSLQFPLLDLYLVDIFLFSSLSCFYLPAISISIPTCKLLCDWRLLCSVSLVSYLALEEKRSASSCTYESFPFHSKSTRYHGRRKLWVG